jgi:hypothetical protein
MGFEPAITAYAKPATVRAVTAWPLNSLYPDANKLSFQDHVRQGCNAE